MISYSLSYRQLFIRIIFAERSPYMLPNAPKAVICTYTFEKALT